MGADGGINISRVSEIKQNWQSIREKLISSLEHNVKNAQTWELKYAEETFEQSKTLPNDIATYEGEDIVKMLNFLKYCDCPYYYDGLIITGSGCNVDDNMNILSNALPGFYIETWT